MWFLEQGDLYPNFSENLVQSLTSILAYSKGVAIAVDAKGVYDCVTAADEVVCGIN